MLKEVFQILIYLLAAYGVLALWYIIIKAVLQKTKSEKSNVKLVLMLKDREEAVEGIVRSLFSGNLFRKFICNGKVTVLDMGSKDETWMILNKLKSDYEQLELINVNEKEKIFNEFEENR
jgi:hypothetical protein